MALGAVLAACSALAQTEAPGFGGLADAGLEDDGTALPASCLLQRPDTEAAPASACLRCHDGSGARAHLRTTHPVDVEYEAAAGDQSRRLRPLAEVLARGGVVPGGFLRCATCHAASSPWAAHLRLPPGATVKAAVNPYRPETYDGTRPAPTGPPPPGSEVSPRPLCLLCHALD